MDKPRPIRKKAAAAWPDLAPETVGFRLDDENRQRLAQRAHKAGVSPHDFARSCVIEALHEDDRLASVRESVLALTGKLSRFEAKFSVAVEALLVTLGNIDISEARAWVEKNLPTD